MDEAYRSRLRAKVIRATGVKESQDKVKMVGSNVTRAIIFRHTFTQDTVNRLPIPFQL